MGLFKKSRASSGTGAKASGSDIPDIVALQTEATGSCCPVDVMPKTNGCSACAGAAVSTALAFKRQAKKAEQEA